jgi:hypothetical protein
MALPKQTVEADGCYEDEWAAIASFQFGARDALMAHRSRDKWHGYTGGTTDRDRIAAEEYTAPSVVSPK